MAPSTYPAKVKPVARGQAPVAYSLLMMVSPYWVERLKMVTFLVLNETFDTVGKMVFVERRRAECGDTLQVLR